MVAECFYAIKYIAIKQRLEGSIVFKLEVFSPQ